LRAEDIRAIADLSWFQALDLQPWMEGGDIAIGVAQVVRSRTREINAKTRGRDQTIAYCRRPSCV
jgi:hypothetical protein